MSNITRMKEMDSTLLTLELMRIVNSWGNKQDSDKVKTALKIAAELHINDFRNSPRSTNNKPPYIEHVLRVALRPIKYFNVKDTDIIISALLHDTVEDHAQDFFNNHHDEKESQLLLLKHYREQFGDNVADTVSALTNPIMEECLNKEEKRSLYVKHVKEATTDNKPALMVKISDFIDNAGSLYITNKNERVDNRTKHLLAKYTPLISFFQTQAENNFKPDQLIEIQYRLNKVATSFESLRA